MTGASFSVLLNQDAGHYTQGLMIMPRITKTTGASLTKFDDYAPRNETAGAYLIKFDDYAPRNENGRGLFD